MVITNNIILIGAMGAGKSTVGRRLAKKLDTQFYDSDNIIEKKTGVDIPTVFEYEGESGFRLREEKVIKELSKLEKAVIATGGGAVLSEDNRTLLSSIGTVFYLQASVDTLLSRLKSDTKRPLIKVTNKAKALSTLLQQREPLYQELADYVIKTDRHTTNWTVNQILKHIKR